MARLVATQTIKHSGKTIKPGESVAGLPRDVVTHLQEIGSVEVLEHAEPSIRDSADEWRNFLIDKEMLTVAEAADMSKGDLMALFAGDTETDEDEDEEAETDDESETGDEE